MTPDRRRVAVERLQARFGVSQRRACQVVGQHRSTQRRAKAPPTAAEERLREHLRDFARCHPRLGWRKARAVAHREGLVTNPKRTRRIWRDEGLQRPPQRRAKRRRLSDGTAARLRASCPNDVWALDCQFDETADLRRIKLLNVVDEFTREALAIEAAHRIGADGVVGTVENLVAQRGAPKHLRMDNGPELTAAVLRDWCRIWGTRTAYIEPGSPWETPFVESFNGRLRDECLNVEDFANITEAKAVLEDWRVESQPLPAPPIPRRAHPRHIRFPLRATPTPIAPGLTNGSPSVTSALVAPLVRHAASISLTRRSRGWTPNQRSQCSDEGARTSSYDRAVVQPFVKVSTAPADGLGAELQRLGKLAGLAPAVDRGSAHTHISGGLTGAQHLGSKLACSV